jgi:hypothetical protein
MKLEKKRVDGYAFSYDGNVHPKKGTKRAFSH